MLGFHLPLNPTFVPSTFYSSVVPLLFCLVIALKLLFVCCFLLFFTSVWHIVLIPHSVALLFLQLPVFLCNVTSRIIFNNTKEGSPFIYNHVVMKIIGVHLHVLKANMETMFLKPILQIYL